jgi:hypothetical protein
MAAASNGVASCPDERLCPYSRMGDSKVKAKAKDMSEDDLILTPNSLRFFRPGEASA